MDQAAGVAAELVEGHAETRKIVGEGAFKINVEARDKPCKQREMVASVSRAMDMEKEGMTRELWLPEKIEIGTEEIKDAPRETLKQLRELLREATGQPRYATNMNYEGKMEILRQTKDSRSQMELQHGNQIPGTKKKPLRS